MFKTERDQFAAALMNVSRETVPRETMARLDRYAGMLVEWNQKFNLVADSTLPHIWTRHFLDSAQLAKHIPAAAKSIADMGSGAGFPGLVLSIMDTPNVQLIEATGKKANFLRAVIEELKLDAVVRQERAESLRSETFDVITARAVGPLLDLLNYARHLMHKDSLALFLKGRNAGEELTNAAKYWTFRHEKIPSLSDSSGSVLILRDIKPKNAAPRKKIRRHE